LTLSFRLGFQLVEQALAIQTFCSFFGSLEARLIVLVATIPTDFVHEIKLWAFILSHWL